MFTTVDQLTMLDYFAAKAMQSLILKGEIQNEYRLGKQAYCHAQEMMGARKILLDMVEELYSDSLKQHEGNELTEAIKDDCIHFSYLDVERGIYGIHERKD